MKRVNIFIAFLFLQINNGLANDLEIKSVGNLFVHNYSQADYKGEKQNWDITIGKNGLIYFANGSLIESGTNHWKQFHMPNQNYIRSVYALSDNSIFVGGAGEMGVFIRGKIPGQREYKSLLNRLDSSFHDFSTVWQIIPHQKSLLIRAGKGLFMYENDTIVPLIFGPIIDYTKVINETIFVRINNEGFGFFNHDKFELFPFGKYFENIKIVDAEELEPGKYLIFTDDQGVFITDLKTIQPFNLLNREDVIKSQISRVCFLQGKYFAIGTVKNGLYIFDVEGNLIQHLNKKNGLQNNTIISMQADSSNNLWLGLDNGISYVELNSCISNFNPETDLGTGYVSEYYNGYLYLGTNQGLFYTKWDTLNPDNNIHPDIREVDNSTGQVWTLYSDGNHLYCGHHKGLFRVDGSKAELLNPVEGCWQINALISNPGYSLESTYRGYYLLNLNKKGEVLKRKKIESIPSNTRYFNQDKNGFFWIKTHDNKLFRFCIDTNTEDTLNFAEMTSYKGLPELTQFRIVGNKGQVFISTTQGLFSFDYNNHCFVNNELYDKIVGKNEVLSEFNADNYNRI